MVKLKTLVFITGVLCGMVLLGAYGLDKQSEKETKEDIKKGHANMAFVLRGCSNPRVRSSFVNFTL